MIHQIVVFENVISGPLKARCSGVVPSSASRMTAMPHSTPVRTTMLS